jgi:hypothetical protein
LTALTNRLFGTRYTDLCYGYNALWRRVVPCLNLPPVDASDARAAGAVWGDGFEIETLLHLRGVQAGLRQVEVPSYEAPRRDGMSNLRTYRDGRRVLATILRERRTTAPVHVTQPMTTQPVPRQRVRPEPLAEPVAHRPLTERGSDARASG